MAQNGNGVSPLSKWQVNLPHYTTGAGLVLMLFAMGVQNAATNNPELLKDWGNTEDITKMAGAVITFMGVLLAHGNNKTLTSAVESAAKAAPVDDNGNQNSVVTTAAAIEQALAEKNGPLARRLLDALHPPGPSSIHGSDSPASEPERSAA